MKKNGMKYVSIVLSVLLLIAMLSVSAAAANYPNNPNNQNPPGTIYPLPTNPNRPNAPMNPSPNRPSAPMNPAPEEETFDIIVRKKWVGDDESSRPESVTVQLVQNGDPIGDPVTLTASRKPENDWKYTWEDLDEDSEYDIIELDTPAGYISSVENVRGNYWVITNTYQPVSQPGSKVNPNTGAAFLGEAGMALLLCCAAGCAACAYKK